ASTGGAGGMGTGGTAGSGTGGASTGGAGGMGTGGMGTGGMGGMGTGGMGGMGTGGGGGGPTCTPEGVFDGAPITAMANKWTWVDFPQAVCRNRTATGIGVRINPNSTKLVIYLQGGGACFNAVSCGTNPSSYGSTNFGNGPSSGIFDSNNMANPLKDWSFVYIPYCTGDVHGGNATGVDVPGTGTPKNQSFVGYANIGHYLKRVVPTFPDVTQILLTGESAGGFGAFYNYDRIAQAFCPRPVDLIDDSGPPMGDTYMTPCLQQRWRTLYNFNATLPPDCVDCAMPNGGGLVNTWKLLGQKYINRKLGLVSSDKDNTISTFYGFGKNNCQNIDGLIPSPLSGAEYAAGLNEVRDMYLRLSPAWSTFYISSTNHTWIGSNNSFYNTTVMGTSLPSWVNGIVTGAAAVHIGP
ncbi:MAG TPA: pectin acetylesterase-family hydrolase, partial [Polyangium sp.]|nr:pectin acetylesterase-family hydrolase [Polyangium sp.]